jgi:hypothetical protein
MITIKGAKLLRTMRQAKSYRSCRTATGLPMLGLELSRICREEVALANRELRRLLLEEAWESRLSRGARRQG